MADGLHDAGNDESPGAGGYLHLAQRAEAFIAEQGGRASEDLLISHVFGSNGTAALWRPLLQDLLSRQENLTLRADGTWLLAGHAATGGSIPLGEFVVLDVETTGLQASRQRVIEIAIARFVGGVMENAWESLCNPQRRVPAYIVKLTGIDDDLLAGAPQFESIAESVAELLDGALVIGHNIEFDLAFVNEELKRIGRPPLVNDRLDTLSLSNRLLAGLRKPSLQAVASHLGISKKADARHRAGPDAALTGQVALTLLHHAWDAGYHSVDELKAISRPHTRRPKERMPRASSVVDRSKLATIPRATGVYIMRDAYDRVLYVGKSKNLRDRVATYFSQHIGYSRKMDGLMQSFADVEVEVVGSELEALLLESQLIRRYQPQYNTALRRHEAYPFIQVDISNPWPRVRLVKSRKDDGARYFGPFRSAATARKTVDLINRVVPLRTCKPSFRDARTYCSPCLQLDLGRCLGPCVGKADRDEYMGLVHSVVDYLDGRDESLHEVLWKGLEDAAAALDFERASRLRRELQASLALTAAQRRLREATESSWLVLALPGTERDAKELLLVLGGRLWAKLHVAAGASAVHLCARLSASWRRFEQSGLREPDHDSVDDMHILSSWLSRHDGHPAVIPFTAAVEPEWSGIAANVLALTPEVLDFDAWRKSRDVAEVEWEDVGDL